MISFESTPMIWSKRNSRILAISLFSLLAMPALSGWLCLQACMVAFLPCSLLSAASAQDEASTKSRSNSTVITRLDSASRFISLPPSQEKKIGDEMNAEIRKTNKVSTNKNLNLFVADVGARLAAQAGARLPLSFTVLDDDETVNAFAIPGGYIFITTGMIRRLDSEGELAAVLGHEIGHVTENHVSARLRNLTGTKLLVGFLGKLTGKNLSDSHVVKVGKYLLMQKFSRGHEYEADVAGADLMAKAGYNPRAMVSLQEKLYKLSQGRLSVEFLNSHPSSAKRAQEVDEYIRSKGLEKPGMILDTGRFKSVKP